MTTFAPAIAPTYSSPVSQEFRVITTSYGDGYNQRVGDGINLSKETWSLNWSALTTAQASNISDFFDTQQGYNSFAWLNPKGTTKNYFVMKYTKTPIGFGMWSIAATLEQDLNN